jgi:hypothetical protein
MDKLDAERGVVGEPAKVDVSHRRHRHLVRGILVEIDVWVGDRGEWEGSPLSSDPTWSFSVGSPGGRVVATRVVT